MTTLYIHIGTPKTGTTSLQLALHRSGRALKAQGAVYPDFGLRFADVDPSRNAFWLTRNGYSEETAEACFEKINALAGEYDTIILSDEILYNSVSHRPDFYRLLREHLNPQIRIRIIVYLRRQDKYIYSWWAQQVKALRHFNFDTQTFPEFLDGRMCRKKSALLDYRRHLQAAIEALGKENVLVRVYEFGRFEGGSIYTDFFGAMGLELTDDFEIPDHLTNSSLRGSVLETKRYLNAIPEFSQPEYQILTYLMRVQDDMEQEGTLRVRNDFPKEKRLAYLESFTESNEWVAGNLLGRQDGVLFREAVEEDSEPESEYTTAEVMEVCGRIILAMMKENALCGKEGKQLEAILGSRAYRIGRIITAPARNIKKAVRKRGD